MPGIQSSQDYLPKTKVFCCKKWVNGVLKKYYSGSPCTLGSGAVRCDAPDPPKPPDPGDNGGVGGGGPGGGGPGGEIGDQDCRQSCREARRIATRQLRGRPGQMGQQRQRIEQEFMSCLKGCGDGGGVGPCAGPGHELPFGSSRCEEGFSIKKDDNGKFWCCDDSTVTPGANPCSEGGGYELTSEVGFGGGGGDPWASTPGMNRSGKWEAHFVWDPITKKYYRLADAESGAYEGKGMDLVCKKFYKRTTSSDGKTWCCPSGEDGDGDGGAGGEFEWSGDLKDLLSRVMDRANYLLDYPRGLTPQERQAVINYAIEGVKAGEAGEKQTKTDKLARIGMLGSGFQAKEMSRISRETRQEGGDVRRELAIDELDRRFQEIMGTTGMVQGLTGTLMEGEKIPEILSGARRQEGQAAINSFLAFLQGSGAGGNNAYWQAIMSQLLGEGQGGGGDYSWLYYLPYLTR